MNSENAATLPGNRFASESFNRNSLAGASNAIQVKYARLQGYLEGYLDQMSASKDAQEELISKLLSEIADILGSYFFVKRRQIKSKSHHGFEDEVRE